MSKPPIALEDRDQRDGRLFSPSARRNKTHIARALSTELPLNASVLEVGSGTGEHGIEILMQRPDLNWQFSDPDRASRESQKAWTAYSKLELNAPIDLDVAEAESHMQVTVKYDAIFSANMIHIAPISALHGLAELSANCMAEDGHVFLYGPFLRDANSAPSNLEFDQSLKRRNPAWGVRELDFVKHIFAKHGFNATSLRDMPKNNSLLGLSRY